MAHGTLTAYTSGCKCLPCRDRQYHYDKERLYRKARGPLLVPRLGAVRRINALRALGYPLGDLALRLGRHPQGLSAVLHTHRPTVTIGFHNRIAAMYDDLSGTPGPSEKTREHAQRDGFVPPLAWDNIDDPDEVPTLTLERDELDIDEVAVELALAGKPVTLRRAERVDAIRRLNEDMRLSDGEISRRLGINERIVFKIRRHELGLPAAVGADGQVIAA